MLKDSIGVVERSLAEAIAAAVAGGGVGSADEPVLTPAHQPVGSRGLPGTTPPSPDPSATARQWLASSPCSAGSLSPPTRLSPDVSSDSEESDLAAAAGCDKFWREMSTAEHAAALQLGWTAEGWDGGEGGPMLGRHRWWQSMSTSRQAAAAVLGFSQVSWDHG